MKQRSDNVDRHGFRPNVGIVVHNARGQVFWGRRVDLEGWQFPQGGIHPDESVEQALFRELREETGLTEDAVEIRGRTSGWLRYRLPRHYPTRGNFRGQKQKWFLLRLLAGDEAFHLDNAEDPEFSEWRWVSYWYPLTQVVAFKREVYRQALRELAPALRVEEPRKRRGRRRKRTGGTASGRADPTA